MPVTLVQKNKSKNIFTWYARVPDPQKKGTVHYFSLGTTSKSEAKVLMQERLKAGEFDIKDESETMTLGEAAVKFEQFERAKGTKPGSIDAFIRGLKSLESLFDRHIASITAKELNETFLENTSANSSRTYMNKKMIISTFFNYVVDVLEIIPKNPIKKAIPKRKVKKAHREFWTTEQIDRIIANAPDPQTRLYWSFMAFAGLRASEAKAMRPEKIYGGKIHVVGKGDKPATIPVCPRLQREIDRFDGEWVFKASQYTLEKTAKKALPEGFQGKAHPHRFRHSFGSNLIRAGINYAHNMFIDCGDIDPRCVHMTYLTLSLLGVPAVVRRGDALALDYSETWFTPAYLFAWPHFKSRMRGGRYPYTPTVQEKQATTENKTEVRSKEKKPEAAIPETVPATIREPVADRYGQLSLF